MTFPIHPALAAFPMLFEDELGALAADIQKNGLRNPVVRHQGQILDGRARLVVCERLGVEPAFVEHEGDPVDFVLRTNGGRRLTAGQRALVAAEILRAKRVRQDTDRVPQGTPTRVSWGTRGVPQDTREVPEAVTAHVIGETMGVSRRSVFRALKLLSVGTEKDVTAVRRGELPITIAWKRLPSSAPTKAPKPKSDRQAIVAAVDRVEKKAHALLDELRELTADALGRKLLEDLLLDLSKQLFELTEAPARDAEPGAS